MIEAPAPTPAAEEAPVEKEGKEEGEEIFKIHQPEFVSKINVIGQIDLAALNQSTRPKKKSKEEKRKERGREGKDSPGSEEADEGSYHQGNPP